MAHGTHVAGLAAGWDPQFLASLAPTAHILPVRAITPGGTKLHTNQGIAWAAANGARVINMSYGGAQWTPERDALRNAARTSVLIAAAGNDRRSGFAAWPAGYGVDSHVFGRMIVVGAVDAQNRIASFSNTPGNACESRRCLRDIWLVAPGVSMMSASHQNPNGYTAMSGTSMAAPIVAGAAANVLAQSPHLQPHQVVDILLRSATDLGARGTDPVFGRGLVNLGRALAPLGQVSILRKQPGTANVQTTSVNGGTMDGALGFALRSSGVAGDIAIQDEYGRGYSYDAGASMGQAQRNLIGDFVTRRLGTVTVGFVGEGFGFTSTYDPGDGLAALGLRSTDAPTVRDATVTFAFQGGMLTFDTNLTGTARLMPGSTVTARSETLSILPLEGSTPLGFTATAFGAAWETALDKTTALKMGFTSGGHGIEGFDAAVDAADGANLVKDGDYTAQTFYAALTHQTKLGQLGLAMTATRETGGLLGSAWTDGYGAGDGGHTISVTAAFQTDLGDGWSLGAFATQAWAKAEGQASLVHIDGTLHARSFGIAAAADGLFQDGDRIDMALVRPLSVAGGTARFEGATGFDENGDPIFGVRTAELGNGNAPLDLTLGYSTTLFNGQGSVAALVKSDVAGGTGTGGGIKFALRF